MLERPEYTGETNPKFNSDAAEYVMLASKANYDKPGTNALAIAVYIADENYPDLLVQTKIPRKELYDVIADIDPVSLNEKMAVHLIRLKCLLAPGA